MKISCSTKTAVPSVVRRSWVSGIEDELRQNCSASNSVEQEGEEASIKKRIKIWHDIARDLSKKVDG
jgi:hypothetical protein